MTKRRAKTLCCWLVASTAYPSLIFAATNATSPELGTVDVRAERPPIALTGILGERLPIAEAPVQVTGYLLADDLPPGSQRLATALQRDASVGENYATTGYYENFTVRGFTLDRGSAYRINGFVVPAEFHIPLDNMESVEILKGVGGLHGGQVSAGGTINFVTRRPLNVRAVGLEVDGHGGSLVTGEVGRALSEPTGIGVRLTAAHGELHPAQAGADGRRDMAGISLDIRTSLNFKVLADVIAQRRTQPAVPGFQLLGGTTLPDSSVRDLNINRQPWSRPVENNGVMAGLRGEWKLSEQLRARMGVAQTTAHINDNLATPWGCNTAPLEYFCGNGDYVLYKYHATERRATQHAESSLHLDTATGPLAHALTLGVERIERQVRQSDFYSSTSYDAFGNALSGNLATTGQPLVDPGGSGTNLAPTKAVQRAAYLADRVTWGSFRVFASARAVTIDQQPSGIREQHVLPQLALSWMFSPNQQLYASWARGLEFGSEAPLTAANAGSLLAPRLTKQTEVGWKGSRAGFGWSAALFQMERPYEYTKPSGSSWAGLGDYVRGGQQNNHGMDISWHSPEQRGFRLEGSQAYIRAVASGSGAFDGVQIQNVPRFSSFVRATAQVPNVHGLETYLDWIARGERNARRDGSVSVPGYQLFNLGVTWKIQLVGQSAVAAFAIRNATDRRYWRDVGEAYSADLLFPGEGRSVAASIRINL